MVRKRQGGSVIVLVALSMMVLLAFAGLVIDGGQVTAQARASQNAADGAALAAAYQLVNFGSTLPQATALAGVVVSQNGLSTTDLTMSFKDATGAPTSDPAQVRTVAATITHVFGTLFLPIVNINSASVTARAEVTVTPATGVCAVCVLDPAASGAVSTGSSASLQVAGGGLAVNSTSATAINGASIAAPSISVTGGVASCTCSPTPVTGAPPVADPLAAVTAPALVGTPRGDFTAAGTIQPGVYNNLSPTGATTLAAGTYVITGRVNIPAGVDFQARNVMFVLACAGAGSPPVPVACGTGQAGASFSVTSAGTVSLGAAVYAPWTGMLIWSDRNNSSPITLSGASDMSMQGTVYAKSALVTISGAGLNDSFASRIVPARLATTGGGVVTVSAVTSQNYSVPSVLVLSL